MVDSFVVYCNCYLLGFGLVLVDGFRHFVNSYLRFRYLHCLYCSDLDVYFATRDVCLVPVGGFCVVYCAYALVWVWSWTLYYG